METDDEAVVRRHYPSAACRLECVTEGDSWWEKNGGPELWDYVVSVEGRHIGGFGVYPDQAWASARERIEG